MVKHDDEEQSYRQPVQRSGSEPAPPSSGSESGSGSLERRGTPSPTSPPSAGELEEPQGIIEKYQAGKIRKDAVLEYFRERYKTQLGMVKKELKAAARQHEALVTTKTEQWIEEINSEHMDFLGQVKLSTQKKRSELLRKLGDQITQDLRQLDQRRDEWPEDMVRDQIERNWEIYDRMADEITEELGSGD